jgi:pimeloyl-ACP methyl ester carboxylesterase
VDPLAVSSTSVVLPGRPSIGVHDFGGLGTPVVIVHAAGFCGGAYSPLAGMLRRRHHVWAVDLRGHGRSSVPADGDFGWPSLAADLGAVLAKLDLEPAHLFGHSLGGAVGLLVEADAPGTFKSMYVYEPPVETARPAGDPVAMRLGRMTRQRRREFDSRDEVLAWLADRPPFMAMAPSVLQAYAWYGFEDQGARVRLRCAPENEAQCYETPRKISLADLSAVATPVAVGFGCRDAGATAECAPGIAAGLPNARLIRYPSLNHMGPLEDPSHIASEAMAHYESSVSP